MNEPNVELAAYKERVRRTLDRFLPFSHHNVQAVAIRQKLGLRDPHRPLVVTADRTFELHDICTGGGHGGPYPTIYRAIRSAVSRIHGSSSLEIVEIRSRRGNQPTYVGSVLRHGDSLAVVTIRSVVGTFGSVRAIVVPLRPSRDS